jgi:hypothetical protein
MADLITSLGNNITFPISATVPANGGLPNGQFCLVVNSTVGRELYVGDASNNPVPACGYRTVVGFLLNNTLTIQKNTIGGSVVLGGSGGEKTITAETSVGAGAKVYGYCSPFTQITGPSTRLIIDCETLESGTPNNFPRMALTFLNSSFSTTDPTSNYRSVRFQIIVYV